MVAAIGWGALAASSLVIGAVLAFARDWSPRQIGTVLAFGAGALISAVSFDLLEEGVRVGGNAAVGAGLAAGALTYFAASRALPDTGGTALALGAFLDGIPEQAVLGIGLAFNDAPSRLLSIYFTSGFSFVAGLMLLSTAALFHSRSSLLLGSILVVAALAAPFAGYPGNYLAMAVLGGGAYLVTGITAAVLAARARRSLRARLA